MIRFRRIETEEQALAAVKQDGFALRFVPDSLKTEAVCLEVVKQNGFALGLIPDSLKTEAACLEAVKQNGLALGYITSKEMFIKIATQLGIETDLTNGETE